MFVIIRSLKIEKGHLDRYKDNFKKESIVMKSPGFIKKELFIQTKNREYDLVKTYIYFENKQAYYVWQGSPEHIAMHKNKKAGNIEKPAEIIETSKEEYEVIEY